MADGVFLRQRSFRFQEITGLQLQNMLMQRSRNLVVAIVDFSRLLLTLEN